MRTLSRHCVTILGILLSTYTASSFAAAPVCADYSLGESRSFSTREGVGARYVAQRTSESDYTVYINLAFKNHEDAMKKKVNQCLAEAQKIGLGPKGQNIRLKLFDPTTDLVPTPKVSFINVRKEGARENSETYFLTSDCRTVYHEMLHVAGLVDEYEERLRSIGATGQGPAYDCRAKSDSLMGSSFLDNTVEQFKPDGLALQCGCLRSNDADTCSKAMDAAVEASKKQRLTTCPDGLDQLGGNPYKGITFPPGKSYDDYRNFPLINTHLLAVTPLRPAHIRKLLWPECAEKNRIYDACTANAYKTSVKNGGKGCLEMPQICSSESTWLEF
jgi:hypothetical protein